MIRYITKTACLSAFLFTATISNAAAASSDGWQRSLLPQDNKKLNEQVFAATSDTSAISFMCNNTKLRALITTESNEGASVLSEFVEGRVKTGKKVTLMVDGKAMDTSRWLLSKKHNVFATNDRATTVMLYRAVTSNQSAVIQPKNQEAIQLSFPEVNKAFQEFGADCGAGKNRKKQS